LEESIGGKVILTFTPVTESNVVEFIDAPREEVMAICNDGFLPR